ncbi:hypothetical protein [Marilutibacter alkalisoli]|uniref:Uncharacterized protein n=1 Tax=Marilutibacter alkalisoli TaxID=2591633 RepID=A0A514BUM4_9GAMM|nr:hypothetical protein [Lysobacter alkalisoli]QDH71108.1 hypothetical protein FKV23_14180 [Lysobacter alkalisoli]
MRTPFRLLALLVSTGLSLAGLPSTTHAHRPIEPVLPRPGHLVEVTVVDRDLGDWLPVYRRRGESWVAGTPGHRYGVRLANTTGQRVLVVLSVDGINAVSGETADPSQAGYVLGPWQSTEITGWRKSLGDVAQFVFTDHRDSYASRTGRPRNVGVIGIAAFTEVAPMPSPHRPLIGRIEHPGADDAAPTAESRAAAPARQRIGTGHGAREWSPASRTHFTRASRHPAQVSEIRYDTRERLIALGIIHNRRSPQPEAPQAFPTGFVPDPPGY